MFTFLPFCIGMCRTQVWAAAGSSGKVRGRVYLHHFRVPGGSCTPGLAGHHSNPTPSSCNLLPGSLFAPFLSLTRTFLPGFSAHSESDLILRSSLPLHQQRLLSRMRSLSDFQGLECGHIFREAHNSAQIQGWKLKRKIPTRERTALQPGKVLGEDDRGLPSWKWPPCFCSAV